VAASGLLTDTHPLTGIFAFEEEFGGPYDDGQHRIYTVTAVSGDGLESGFSQPVYAPGIGEPVAVALAPDGARVVLNNWNPYPLLRQQPDGRYTHRLVNVHYNLGNARYLAYDPLGRLLVNGFGESPFGRKAVRVYDADLRPVLAFGDSGSGPGQFVSPAGVAVWGETCTYGGPYEPDEHTLLLLHFDGSYAGTQGEVGTAAGTSFAVGRHGQGVLINEADTLTYPTAGNLDGSVGAIEFWVQPQWNGDDGGNHTLFWWGAGDEFLHLRKDPISNLVFDRFYHGGSCGAPHNVADWRADEWHHLAFTWQGTEMRLYEDGLEVARTECGGVARPMASSFYVGSGTGGADAVDAIIDELRISDVPRLGNSDTCGRILVADSGNNRVQAFDSLGHFLSAYGAPGSGPGQFDNPQGLAVHSSGRVIVADSGNDRLQLLSFDGARFGFLRSITAGFNGPTGVTTYGQDRIVVADTGNNTIKVLTRDGSSFVVAEYSQPNDGYIGPFDAPRGVAVEPDGGIVVADTGNHRVVTVRGVLSGSRKLWLPLAIRRQAGQRPANEILAQ
ncbi:MAG: hypothetical protein FJ280_31440, partial [Planctomycetes bacterium]|nr:hypothetical protein [Planctomycetota bacterium]